jgi:hypothetical protein
MGLPDVWNAQSVAFSRLTEEQARKFEEWIWEPHREPFSVTRR